MQLAVMVAGLAAEIAGWSMVATRGKNVWRLMPLVLGAMGLAAVLARPPVAAAEVSTVAAFVVGLASGLALYVATRAFVWTASHWEPFRLDVVRRYADAGTVSLGESLLLSLIVMVPCEELFWRGLFQARLSTTVTAGAAAAIAWGGYVAANLASRSLPIVAGAVVGGALWAGLGWWSGGVLASAASHILWTGLMLALPPGAGLPGLRRARRRRRNGRQMSA